ncbi:HK97-gp10 family putative phage morphogenesis protein [Pacificoceanicola onchidii]|uniref:HK97-gp10 family putative phage morphogenesis protein n=1 Tax=Pacificoceanicola onchidii TaxID=2562685 RepID=UPI0010A345AA|nr:HK97-gp10 family putative phage morphogenesis protein [Pacificoceanicola onchidii]
MVDGVPAFRRFMYQTVPARVRQAAKTALEAGANELVEQMRRLAPKDTGALRDSINWTWGDAPAGALYSDRVGGDDTGGIRVTIYVGGTERTKRRQARNSGTRLRDQNRSGYFDADNARYQEFGTSRMPANPFFWPAYRATKRRIKARITREINKAIKAL